MKLTYTLRYEVDTDRLCDNETLKKDFNNSWLEFMQWFYAEEAGEVKFGFGKEPELKSVQTEAGNE